MEASSIVVFILVILHSKDGSTVKWRLSTTSIYDRLDWLIALFCRAFQIIYFRSWIRPSQPWRVFKLTYINGFHIYITTTCFSQDQRNKGYFGATRPKEHSTLFRTKTVTKPSYWQNWGGHWKCDVNQTLGILCWPAVVWSLLEYRYSILQSVEAWYLAASLHPKYKTLQVLTNKNLDEWFVHVRLSVCLFRDNSR